MRRTRKRGGYISDEHGRYANRATEIARFREAIRRVDEAVGEAEKAAATVEFLQVALSSNVAIRRRAFRDVLRSKLEAMWDRPSMLEHRRLISQVSAYLDSIPESEIVGGKRTHTRKRGGLIVPKEMRALRLKQEVKRFNEALNVISEAPVSEKPEKARLVLELALTLRELIKRRKFNQGLRGQLEVFRRDSRMNPYKDLIEDVQRHLDSIPESELIGGGKRKTRKIHRK